MSKFKPIEDYTSTGNKAQDEAFRLLVEQTKGSDEQWYYIDVGEPDNEYNSFVALDRPSWSESHHRPCITIGYTP